MLGALKVPESYADYLRVGTCSWKYDSWKGLVYPPDKLYRPDDYLSDYAEHFNTVEIDQWFWSLFPGGVKLPDPRVVKQYADSVPADFTFSIKVPNAITLTHYYSKRTGDSDSHAARPNPHFLDIGLFNRFLETLSPMHSKLGPIMFQFEYLNKKKMPSMAAFLDRFGEFLMKAPQGFMYAVETRNPNCLQEDFVDFLRRLRLGFVLLDGYYMPPISQVIERLDVRTADFSVVRLHGPDRAGIEEQTGGNWSRIVEPKDTGLEAAAGLARANAQTGVTTYVNVNNHYEGCAPLTIERLMTRL